MTCRGVVSFTRTGYIRNVAGDKIAAPTSDLLEIPYIERVLYWFCALKIPASGNRRYGAVGDGGGQLAYLFVAAVAGGEKAGGLGLQLVVCQKVTTVVPVGKGG